MSKSLRFCFRIDKSVGVAEDELGNYLEAFMCVKASGVNSYTLQNDKYKSIQDAYRKIAANQLGCEPDLVVPITLNEYLDNTEDDD